MDARTLASLLGAKFPEELKLAAARPLAELSRGERQRVVFRLLLSTDAELLVVDDPEVSSVAEVQAWREACARSSVLGRAVLLMSRHEVALAALCPTLHILFDGRVIASGATEALVPGALHLARKRFG
jgi:ABC-type cobalamin/Fe3+-siderophores transport system ATPase subunit